MKDKFDFRPLVSSKLLEVNAAINPKGILRGDCSYDVIMVWDNGIHLGLQTDNEGTVKRLRKAIGLKLVKFGDTLPNHATMSVMWFFENDYCCTFNVIGWIQWS